jgi:glycosyltransferase involved in cell wall biosynthesis
MPSTALLIPCKNAAGYLPRLFEGVCAQTRPFDEIICYDDHSTDNTTSVASALGAKVLLPDGPSTGPARARNRLAAAATADWIHFHDADDLISPTYLETLLSLCKTDTEVVFCDADWIAEKNRKIIISWRYDAHALAADPVSYLIRHPVGINNGVFRRKSFLAVGGFDESLFMWEDNDVYVRLAASGASLQYVNQVLTWSLRHPDSFSHDYRKSWRCRLDALEKYIAELKPSTHLAIAEEAERAASNLVALGDLQGASRGITLCHLLGHQVPTTKNIVLCFLRKILSELTLLRLQQYWRHSH